MPEATDEAILREAGYQAARQLPDGTWIALQRMMFTTGLFIVETPTSYKVRWCYEHAADAVAAFLAWTGPTAEAPHPPGDWVVMKPGQLLNPRLFAPDDKGIMHRK